MIWRLSSHAQINKCLQLAKDHSDDADVLSWYAEAAMDLEPWAYYDYDDRQNPIAKPLTQKVIDSLQKALTLEPLHPLALHLMIHIMEPSNQPQQAVNAGEVLRELPLGQGYGHLVHMPGKSTSTRLCL